MKLPVTKDQSTRNEDVIGSLVIPQEYITLIESTRGLDVIIQLVPCYRIVDGKSQLFSVSISPQNATK